MAVEPSLVSEPQSEAKGPQARRRRRGALRLYGPISKKLYFGAAVISLIGLLLLWWAAVEVELTSTEFLPAPSAVWDRGVELVKDGTLWQDSKVSFGRIMIGFLISTAIALPLGVLMGTYRIAEAAVEPSVNFIRYMPAVAFVPLTVLWIGVGETQKWMIVFIGTFFQQVLMVRDTTRRVPREYVDLAYTLGLRDVAILFRVVLPAAAPAMWDTLRITLGWAWTWLVVAELIAAQEGLGARVVAASRFFDTDVIFVAILTIGLIGLVTDQIMRLIGMRLFKWESRGRR